MAFMLSDPDTTKILDYARVFTLQKEIDECLSKVMLNEI